MQLPQRRVGTPLSAHTRPQLGLRELFVVLNPFFVLAGAAAQAKGSVCPREGEGAKVSGKLRALCFKSLL